MGQWRRATPHSQKHPRIATNVTVQITTVEPEVDPASGAPFFRSAEVTTANLSRGGAFIHSWEPLEPGRRVVADLTLPGGREIQLVARVAWTRRELRPTSGRNWIEPGYGIQFIGGTQTELRQLEDALQSLAPVAPTPTGRVLPESPSTSRSDAPSRVSPPPAEQP